MFSTNKVLGCLTVVMALCALSSCATCVVMTMATGRLSREERGLPHPPYVIINARVVRYTFRAMNGSIRAWSFPFDLFEENFQQGDRLRRKKDLATVQCNIGEKRFRVVDVRPFIQTAPFRVVMKELAGSVMSDVAILDEVFQVLKQGPAYVSEIQETPRFPLETLTGAGGDCEDTTILAASLLGATEKGWKIQVVYMDANHPEAPREINHVALFVKTPEWAEFVETTSKSERSPYTRVVGCYYDLVGTDEHSRNEAWVHPE